jgi:cytochrome c oxidase cbb3-type subunit 2
VRSKNKDVLAAALVLVAVGLAPPLPAESQDASPAETETDLSERVSRLEARLAEERREDADLRGQRVYSRVCAACHGRDGGGDGPGAAELDPWPRDFTVGKYRTRSTLSGEPPQRGDIEEVVRRGLTGTSMPAFGGVLSENQIADVVEFIVGLGPSSLVAREPEALSIPEFPAPDAARLSDGRAVYLILGCWKCHGLRGNGRGPSAKGLKSDEGQRLWPRDFRYEPFKGGRSPETVARAALSGLIGTPMPSHAEIMVVPREAIDAFAESIPVEARPELEDFRRTAPTAAHVLSLEDDDWQELRDENLVSLAHYVLSLDRTNRLVYRLFRQRPESEGRNP